jgi:hypothetical protein
VQPESLVYQSGMKSSVSFYLKYFKNQSEHSTVIKPITPRVQPKSLVQVSGAQEGSGGSG